MHTGLLSDIEGLNFKITDGYNLKGEIKMAISNELLEILACPKCKGDLILNDGKDGLICEKCKLLYAIKDDIPIMLVDEATSIKD